MRRRRHGVRNFVQDAFVTASAGVQEQPQEESAADAITEDVSETSARAAQETAELVEAQATGSTDDRATTRLGAKLDRSSPFYRGFLATLGVLLAYGLVQVILQVSDVLAYIVFVLFLALGLEPFVARLARLGLRRGWSVLIVMIGVLCVATFVGWLIVPTVIEQVNQLITQTPHYLDELPRSQFVQQADERFHVVNRIEGYLKDAVNENTVVSIFGGVLGAGKALIDGLIATAAVVVLTVYFLAAMPHAKASVYEPVPRSRRVRVAYLTEEISHRVGCYVLGQAVVAVINGILSYIILIVLGLPFPLLLATLVGLLALIPIVGTLTSAVIITLVGLSDSWQVALIVLGYYILYHAFEAYILSPRIMRCAVDVPAAFTIVAVLAGGTLMGIIGALIAIPVVAGLFILYQQVVVPRQHVS